MPYRLVSNMGDYKRQRAGRMTILADHKKLIYSGRIDWSNPLEPIFVFPCTFVKMKFTGNVLKVHVKNCNAYWNNYLGVLLDGEQSSVLLPVLHTR